MLIAGRLGGLCSPVLRIHTSRKARNSLATGPYVLFYAVQLPAIHFEQVIDEFHVEGSDIRRLHTLHMVSARSVIIPACSRVQRRPPFLSSPIVAIEESMPERELGITVYPPLPATGPNLCSCLRVDVFNGLPLTHTSTRYLLVVRFRFLTNGCHCCPQP